MRTNIADITLCLLHSSNPKLDLARIRLRVKTKHPDYTGYWLFPLPITSTIFRYTLLIKYSVIYLTCVIPTPSSVRMRAEQSILTLIMNVLIMALLLTSCLSVNITVNGRRRGLVIQHWRSFIEMFWYHQIDFVNWGDILRLCRLKLYIFCGKLLSRLK